MFLGTVVFNCVGVPAHASCVVSPGSAPAGWDEYGFSAGADAGSCFGAAFWRTNDLVASLLPLGMIVLRRRWGAGLLMLCPTGWVRIGAADSGRWE